MASQAKLDYIKKLIAEMPDEQRVDMLADLLSAPENQLDQIELALLGDYTEAAEERWKNFGKMQGMSTGYPKLDKLTKGLVGGELTIIAGKTSHGKTTLAVNIANKVALQGKTVLFVTLEMTHAEIASRFMQINGGKDSEDYARASSLVTFQSATDLNWRSIDGLMERAKEMINVDLVVIDHLHYFTRELEHVAEDLGRITKELKKNAIRYDVPVVLLSHVRRTAKQALSATLDDLRGSSYIAQDSDIVLMVSRVRTAPTCLTVQIEKNRNRGFDYDADTVNLYVDKIKIYNDEVESIDFSEPTGAQKNSIQSNQLGKEAKAPVGRLPF